MDYTKEYITKNPSYHIGDSQFKANDIVSVLPQNKCFNSLLDVACGAGKITLLLNTRLKLRRTVGIDISRPMIKKAKELDIQKNITWKVTDIFDFKPKNFFDLIVCADIIEHIEDDKIFLLKLKKLGHSVVIKAPLEDTIFYRLLRTLKLFDPWKYTENQYGHIHHYSEKSLDSLIMKTGWKIIKSNFGIVPKRDNFFWKIVRFIIYPLNLFDGGKIVYLIGGYKVYYLTHAVNHSKSQ